MTGLFKPLSTQNLAGIIALSQDDFMHINSRVKSCISSKGVVDLISKSLPPFREALSQAQYWNGSLFPNLKYLCSTLNKYADISISSFTALNDRIKQLEEYDEIPPILQQLTFYTFYALQLNTTPISEECGALSKKVVAFIEANSALDDAILSKRLAFQFNVIRENLMNLNVANAHLRGQWQALDDDLKRFLKDFKEGDVTMALFASLEIENAIAGWKLLQKECSRFMIENG